MSPVSSTRWVPRSRRTPTPEKLVKLLEEVSKNASKSVPDLSAQATRLAGIFRGAELNADNDIGVLFFEQRIGKLNKSASRVRLSHTGILEHVSKIIRLQADFELNLRREVNNTAPDTRLIPLGMFQRSGKGCFQFMEHFAAPACEAMELLERLARPELHAPSIRIIEEGDLDGAGGLRETYMMKPGLEKSETHLMRYRTRFDDPRLIELLWRTPRSPFLEDVYRY